MGSTTVKCRICSKHISYTPSNVGALGDHLLHNHPQNCVAHFTFDNEPDTINTVEKKNIHKTKRKMYKTTVETWRPGTAPLKCTACNKSGQPLIRKQRNKVTQSSLGALCLLGCWPLCFLPFILGGSNIMNLYCKFCGEFLGTYDRKTGRVQSPEEANSTNAPNTCDCNNL